MRRAILSLSLLFSVNILSAGSDRWGNVRQAIYRSSTTSTAEQGAILTTSACFVHAVTVNTSGSSSSMELFNGRISSNTAAIGPDIDTTAKETLLYDMYFSSGLIYNNKGGTPADVTILWDLVLPY